MRLGMENSSMTSQPPVMKDTDSFSHERWKGVTPDACMPPSRRSTSSPWRVEIASSVSA